MKYVGSKNRLSKDLVPIIQGFIDDNDIKHYYEPFCLGKNQNIYTEYGIKPIKDINVGDWIYDNNGKLCKVVRKIKSPHNIGKRITVKGNIKINATDKHKFYLSNGDEILTQDLKIGDCLLTGTSNNTLNPPIDLAKFITISSCHPFGRSGCIIDERKVKLYHNAPVTNRIIPITQELMRCYGLVVAEGDKGQLTMNKDEYKYLSEFVDYYESIIGIQSNNKKYYYRKNAIQLAVPYKTIYEKLFFQAMNIGYDARNKNISFLFKCSPDMCLEAIRYMIIGDGSICQKGKYRSINYKTSSRTLAYQLQTLLSMKFNIKATISYGWNKERYIENRKLNASDYYNISIHREDDIHKIIKIPNENITIHEKTKGFFITDIQEIEDEFYDITIDSSAHRFILDGGIITHNCGGANMIDKIRCNNKFGSDIHPYLIALLKQARDDTSIFPATITEEEYKAVRANPQNYPDWYVGLVGFCSFGGKWWGGYPRGYKNDKVTPRDICNETIRNLIKQAPNLKDIKFACCSFEESNKISNFVIYCDIPYRYSTKYATDDFPYERFYDWAREMSKDNIVLISEYWMPDDFECIWQKQLKCTLDKNSRSDKTEKLFKWKG